MMRRAVAVGAALAGVPASATRAGAMATESDTPQGRVLHPAADESACIAKADSASADLVDKVCGILTMANPSAPPVTAATLDDAAISLVKREARSANELATMKNKLETARTAAREADAKSASKLSTMEDEHAEQVAGLQLKLQQLHYLTAKHANDVQAKSNDLATANARASSSRAKATELTQRVTQLEEMNRTWKVSTFALFFVIACAIVVFAPQRPVVREPLADHATDYHHALAVHPGTNPLESHQPTVWPPTSGNGALGITAESPPETNTSRCVALMSLPSPTHAESREAGILPDGRPSAIQRLPTALKREKRRRSDRKPIVELDDLWHVIGSAFPSFMKSCTCAGCPSTQPM